MNSAGITNFVTGFANISALCANSSVLLCHSMKIFIFLLSSFISTLSWAQAKACYEIEIDFRTKKTFSSHADYQATVYDWLMREPAMPGPLSLWRAYGIYKREQQKALGLGNDKTAHCYLGCRIAQDVNYVTADYVGWYKEDQDIRDCKRGSQFDEYDYIATIKGAEIGEQQSDPMTCQRACKQLY